jgi:hypothetical protein
MRPKSMFALRPLFRPNARLNTGQVRDIRGLGILTRAPGSGGRRPAREQQLRVRSLLGVRRRRGF